MKRRRKDKTKVLLIALLSVFLIIVIRSFSLSLFVKRPSTLNVLFYGDNTKLYSLNFVSGEIYYVPFPSDAELFVPGGYNLYKVGALQKLAELENDNNLITRTFSYAIGSFVNYYFVPYKTKIIYSSDKKGLEKIKPDFSYFLFHSNLSFIDRVYLFLYFLKKDRFSFKKVEYPLINNIVEGKVLDTKKFLRDNRGLFYFLSYRNEKRSVQLIYTKHYSSALNIAKVIEGSGVRVLDISKRSREGERCEIVEDKKRYSLTAENLAKFFDCSLVRGRTHISDIIFVLNKLENYWKN